MKQIRKISKKRARKLRKLGEFVWFDVNLDSYVWEMKKKRHLWNKAS